MGRSNRPDLQTELYAFRAVDARTPEGLAQVRAGLGRKTGLVVAAAAERLREAGLTGHQDALLRAYDAMSEDPVRRDPGCAGKIAVVRALDELGWNDPEVFARAARCVQLEPAWGKPVDTAGPVRRFGLGGLVRTRWEGTPAVIGDHLVDPDPHVRSYAADAVAAWGEPMGIAVLRLKLGVGDPDPGVLIDALVALFGLDRPGGIALARAWLTDEPAKREVAALALGQSRLPEAIDVLVSALGRTGESEERRTLYVALGTLRLDASRAWLLDALAGPDALHALEALRPHRFEPGLVDEVRRRAPRLSAQIDDVLEP